METLNPTHSLTQSDVTSLWWGNELVGSSWHEEMVSWDVSGALAGCPSWYHQSMTSTDDSGTRSQVCWVQHINHFLTMENQRAAKNELDNKCINIFTYSFCRVSVHWRNLSALCSRWTEHTQKTVIVKKLLIWLFANYVNWNPKSFWHTLFSWFPFGSASEIIECTRFAPFTFEFLFRLTKCAKLKGRQILRVPQ